MARRERVQGCKQQVHGRTGGAGGGGTSVTSILASTACFFLHDSLNKPPPVSAHSPARLASQVRDCAPWAALSWRSSSDRRPCARLGPGGEPLRRHADAGACCALSGCWHCVTRRAVLFALGCRPSRQAQHPQAAAWRAQQFAGQQRWWPRCSPPPRWRACCCCAARRRPRSTLRSSRQRRQQQGAHSRLPTTASGWTTSRSGC